MGGSWDSLESFGFIGLGWTRKISWFDLGPLGSKHKCFFFKKGVYLLTWVAAWSKAGLSTPTPTVDSCGNYMMFHFLRFLGYESNQMSMSQKPGTRMVAWWYPIIIVADGYVFPQDGSNRFWPIQPNDFILSPCHCQFSEELTSPQPVFRPSTYPTTHRRPMPSIRNLCTCPNDKPQMLGCLGSHWAGPWLLRNSYCCVSTWCPSDLRIYLYIFIYMSMYNCNIICT
jgi:hypothetical protein